MKKSDVKKDTQKEWIIPCNVNYYDISSALSALKIIDWKQPVQMNNANVGDLVYIYCKSKGTGSVAYKGAILEVNKTEDIIDDSAYSGEKPQEGRYFELAVFREYSIEGLEYSKLKENGLKSRLQGPTIVKDTVAEYLHKCDDIQRNMDRADGTIPNTCLPDFPIKIYEILSHESLKNKKEYERKRNELLKKKDKL